MLRNYQYHFVKVLKCGYVCDFYGGYFAFFVIVNYCFSVVCWFAFSGVSVFESYVEVAYVFVIVYSCYCSRQLQAVFRFNLFKHFSGINV